MTYILKEEADTTSISSIPRPEPSSILPQDQKYVYVTDIQNCTIGESNCTYAWVAYEYAPGSSETLNVCGESNWWYGPTGSPEFPVDLGPFDLPTYQNCTMSIQSASDGGVIICGDIETYCTYVSGNITNSCGMGSVLSKGNRVCIFVGH